MGSEHGGLPDLAFLDLAVAHQGIDTEGLFKVLRALRHAAGHREALAQGTGGHIHAGDQVHVRMALKIGINVTEGGKILHREEAPVRQNGVETRRVVALGEHEAVAVFLLRILRIDIHLNVIEVRENISRGKAAARVSGLGAVGRGQDAFTNINCLQFQFFP